MRRNVGRLDRDIRLIVGAAALVTGLTVPLPRGWRIGLFSLAASNLITAATQYCPINQALGINTDRRRIKEATKGAARVARAIAA